MDDAVKIEVRVGFEVMGEYPVAQGEEILIGRSNQADIVLDSFEISRQHARVTLTDRGFFIRDLSLNGLFSDGRQVEDGEFLPMGTAVEMGSFKVVLGRSQRDGAQEMVDVRRRILNRLIEHVDLASIDRASEDLRPRVEAALLRIASVENLQTGTDIQSLVGELADEALGLGPLERLLKDDSVTEIMVVDPQTIYVERGGCLEHTGLCFTSEVAVRTIIERIITPLGRRIDESSPMVDARLADGSRVNAVIPPLAIKGPCITIRKFPTATLGINDLVCFGSLDENMADYLMQAVAARANIVISGGTGSGKTTLLNALSGAIPPGERIVTVEDAAELRLSQNHVVSLESRPANAEGKGGVTIRDLVRNALRMRPDRIVVGECRGGEALDMLQAMNTGHDGSLTTTHANSPVEAVSRIETLCLMAGLDLPSRAIREQIAGAIDVIVQQTRLSDGRRRITSIAEVSGLEDDGTVQLHEVFRFVDRKNRDENEVFLATGWQSEYMRYSPLSNASPAEETVR